MNDLFEQMEADSASDVESLNTEGVKSIAEVARLLRQKEEEVEKLEGILKEAKKERDKISLEDLPSLLQEIGITSFELSDGSKVKVGAVYGAHIKVENREEAFTWLRENAHDDIIKNTVSCEFKRGEDTAAGTFIELVQAEGFDVDQKVEVHSQTLKAFVKEMIEGGKDFPEQLFGAYVGHKATIKR
mgnify:CR=1 FL=1|jgi:hypothetical protein|tara:strand:+ start:1603 stop:2163 length:561 start_codon:yes stop_codon:yes gene_type:complete